MENSNSNKEKNQNYIISKKEDSSKEEKKEIINKKTKKINKISNNVEDLIDFKNVEFITNQIFINFIKDNTFYPFITCYFIFFFPNLHKQLFYYQYQHL